jgi:ABC-2 type transport system ATP-binding protein
MRNLAGAFREWLDADRPDPEPGDAAIRTRALSKLYRNPWTLKVARGVEALDLEVRRGEIFGYLGANGAGKTTTLKLLAGLHKPTSGRAWILGESVTRPAARRRIGFLPEQPYFYDYLTAREFLEFMGRLSGLDGAQSAARTREWLARVGLADHATRTLRKFSKGMLQRVGLAAALLHEPEVVLLDEPMSGLDPLGRRDVRDLILEQRERGATVLFSSHILPDVEALCDRVAIVHGGRLARVARVGELLGRDHGAVEITLEGHPLLEMPAPWSGALARTDRADETQLLLADDSRLDELLPWLLRAGAKVRSIVPHRGSLEDLYLETTQGPVAESTPNRRQA